MDTINVLLEKMVLIKKLEYAKQRLFDIATDLSYDNKPKNELADEAYKTVALLEDKNIVWK
ncbi:hypothetical protein [Kineothrix sedimenti]|uniref:Uncharacterized protein n=1 Tax=Kineothrix sedimenti TaxID=3123317 RepID=A0ABZ3F097_9FIRM